MSAAAALKSAPEPNETATLALGRAVIGETIRPSGALSRLNFRLISDRAGFDALEPEWNALFETSGRSTQMFQTFNWLWHWANHFLCNNGAPGDQLAIVTGRHNGRLVLICPFLVARSHGVAKLTFMGDPVSQYGDVIADTDTVSLDDLKAALDVALSATSVDLVRIRKVRADAVIAPLMTELGAATTESQLAPYLDFAGSKDFAAYEQRYSGSARRNRRRQRRRLDDLGTVELERRDHGVDARELASVAMTLKRAWLNARGLVSPALNDARTTAFFRDACAAAVRPAGCEMATIKVNGEIAALELSVSCKDRSAIHVIAYNLKFEKAAAGALLMEDSIKRACDRGLAVYDLLAPGDGYKLDWADQSVAVHDWALPMTLTGHAYAKVYLGVVRSGVKRMLSAMPSPVRWMAATGLALLLLVGEKSV